MSKYIKNTKVFIIAVVSFLAGILWWYNTNWDYEPLILIITSALEILFYFILRDSGELTKEIVAIESNNENTVNVHLNFASSEPNEEIQNKQETQINTRDAQIEFMKSKIKILFIDDDKNFNVVRILRDSGWKHTKTVLDIKSLDSFSVKESHIYFVDINGVGKLLNLEAEGLDLALMLKQKYPDKKIVIYSANKNNNPFHQAWDKCDFKLEKNALPYQFQNIVEQYSIELYKYIK